MNAGEFNEKIAVLVLDKTENIFSWNTKGSIWGKVESLKGKNLFSNVGIGAKSVKFTIRMMSLTLHNAFLWQGKHCFLTDIVEMNRMYYEVTTAIIEPKICTVERTPEPTLDKLNRPVYAQPELISFPGCLTEKYLGHTQEKPMALVETRYVLVTPKVIELSAGELVTVGNETYIVEIPHTLDEFKNEYEISVRSEA